MATTTILTNQSPITGLLPSECFSTSDWTTYLFEIKIRCLSFLRQLLLPHHVSSDEEMERMIEELKQFIMKRTSDCKCNCNLNDAAVKLIGRNSDTGPPLLVPSAAPHSISCGCMRFSTPPLAVLIARSSGDGFTSWDVVDRLQRKVLAMVQELLRFWEELPAEQGDEAAESEGRKEVTSAGSAEGQVTRERSTEDPCNEDSIRPLASSQEGEINPITKDQARFLGDQSKRQKRCDYNLVVHDLCEDAVEKAFEMFLHPAAMQYLQKDS